MTIISRDTVFVCLLAGLILTAACAGPAGSGPTSLPAASATPEPRSAILSELRNSVEAREAAETDWQSANEGQQIVAGAGAKTGSESRVRIDITDGSILRIAPNSIFELRELSPQAFDPVTRLYLEAGKVFVQVTRALGGGSFEIETPVGTAGVRGSLMSVAYDPATGQMTITCLEGQCRLTGGAASFTDLDAGQQSEILGLGQDPAPAGPMDEAQLVEWAQEFPEAGPALAALPALPAATATPTPTPSLTPTPAAQSACDHPFLPLRLGAIWIYAPTIGEGSRTITVTVSAVQGDTQNAMAEASDYAYQCDANGIVFSATRFPVGTVANFSGVYLPPVEVLALGYSWNYVYQSVFGSSPNSTITTTFHLTHTVVGTDPVSVNGQAYDGLQILVDALSETQTSGVFANRSQSEYTYTRVHARGVGLVEDISRRLRDFSIP